MAGGEKVGFRDIGGAEGREDGGGILGVDKLGRGLVEQDVESELGESTLGLGAKDCVALYEGGC